MHQATHRMRARLLTIAIAIPTTVIVVAAHAGPPVVGRPSYPGPSPDKVRFFNTEVLPILKESCFNCHGSGAQLSGGLSMTTHDSLFKGGVSGSALRADKPEDSLLVKAVNYQGREMPPSGKLPPAKIAVLTKWVAMGAPMPLGSVAAPGAAKPSGIPVTPETKNFWSFKLPKRSPLPTVKNKAWSANPIDRFILAGLEKNALLPAPRASKIALLRRATYDLTGLPPTPKEVADFLADTSPKAYEKVVDRLLASPHYGERWARHWLDLVRYAESNSFERDNPKPFAWRYRDYVIGALNNDKPYNQFITEQLAGDELPKRTDEALIATGYYRLGAWDDEPSDHEQARYDELDDIVATTGQVFLGLTVNCSRCHDHKIDPIPQKDYYRLLSFFQGTKRYGGTGGSVEQNSLRAIGPEEEKQRFAREDSEYHRKLSGVLTRLKAIEGAIIPDLSSVEKEEWGNPQARLAALKKRVPAKVAEETYREAIALDNERRDLEKSPPKGLELALCVTEGGKTVPATHVMLRGNPHVPGDEVQPGFLSVLSPPEPVIPELPSDVASSGRRSALAAWIASANNPLTARVFVNRIWQHHFGRGIVRTTSNFGFQGSAPTHPELLDWLSTEVVKSGWKIKTLHRLIMLSNTYCMSSKGNAVGLKKDPENNLFWRFDMRRLDAEEIRDSMLAVNGTLNLQMGGPPVYPKIPAEVLAGESRPGANWEDSTPEQMARRSVYIHIKRSLTVPILASFDVADTDFTCPVRFATTQPTQALGLINSTFANEEAALFAEYARKQAPESSAKQISLILARVTQRTPTAAEIARGQKFIKTVMTRDHVSEQDALKYYCVVALNLNEFIYLD